MPSYVTEAEFLDQGLPIDALTGILSATIIQALEWASSTANSYLRKRYTLPLVAWDDDLRRVVVKIAVYDLMCIRGFRPGSETDAAIVKNHDDAILWLKAVAKSEIEPSITDSSADLDEGGPLASAEELTDFSFYTGSSEDEGCCNG
jgi:phage gp36-like protein